jgi:uncharacterized small protein (DUF1192 family)
MAEPTVNDVNDKIEKLEAQLAYERRVRKGDIDKDKLMEYLEDMERQRELGVERLEAIMGCAGLIDDPKRFPVASDGQVFCAELGIRGRSLPAEIKRTREKVDYLVGKLGKDAVRILGTNSVSSEIEGLRGEVARLNSRLNGLVAAIPRPAR